MRRKLSLDLVMTALILLSFAYQLTGNTVHELLGFFLLALFVVHNLQLRIVYGLPGVFADGASAARSAVNGSWWTIPVEMKCYLGLALLGLFLFVEQKKRQPILDLSLFKNAVYTISIACVFILFVVNGGLSFLQPLYLEDVRGMSAARSGLVLMATPIVTGAVSPVSGALADHFGPAPLTLIGLCVMLAGTLMLGTLTATTPLWVVIAFLCLVGAGAGLFSAPNISMVMGAAPKSKLGIAGSVNGFMRNFGFATGVTVFSGVLYALMGARAGQRVTGYLPGHPEIFLSAMRTLYRVAAGLLAVGLLLTATHVIRTQKSTHKNNKGKPP